MEKEPHDTLSKAQRLRKMKHAFTINAGIFAIEITSGALFDSNGLLSEAIHESADTAAHGLDVYGETNQKRSQTLRKTAGTVICMAGAGIAIKSGIDLTTGPEVPDWPAGAAAALGAGANIYIANRLHSIDDHSHHSKGQLRHAQTDVIKSSAMAVGIVAAIATEKPWIDSAVGVAGGLVTVAGNIGPTIEAWKNNEQASFHSHGH